MRQKKFIFITAALLVLSVAIFIIQRSFVSVQEFGSKQADAKILIAYEKTIFKETLLMSLIDALSTESRYIKVVDHRKKQFATENAADYSAIILLNSGVHAQIRPQIIRWLEGVTDKKTVILLTTYRDTAWNIKTPAEIDSITVPSRLESIDTLTATIVTKISHLLSQ